MPDKKTPKEASQLFHNIIKASVSPKATGDAKRKRLSRKVKSNKARSMRKTGLNQLLRF